MNAKLSLRYSSPLAYFTGLGGQKAKLSPKLTEDTADFDAEKSVKACGITSLSIIWHVYLYGVVFHFFIHPDMSHFKQSHTIHV